VPGAEHIELRFVGEHEPVVVVAFGQAVPIAQH
jgi:hypothetical protein